jgi:phage virion morphogenesis protein
MSFAIQFNAKELMGVADVMQRLSSADKQELADNIGALVVDQTLFRFDSETDPDGNKWIPSQRAEATGGKTLQQRGHLRDSITYIVGMAGEQIEIGSNMIYAAIHQFGGIATDYVALDARTYLGINQQDGNDIGDLVNQFYEGLLA